MKDHDYDAHSREADKALWEAIKGKYPPRFFLVTNPGYGGRLEDYLRQLSEAEKAEGALNASNCPACGRPLWEHTGFHDEFVCVVESPDETPTRD